MKKIISVTLAISWLYKPDEISQAFNKAQLLKHIENISLNFSVKVVPFFCIQFDTLEDLHNFPSFPVECLTLYGRGLSRSRNAVINYTTTDYIHFLDLDIDFYDVILYLTNLANSITKSPSMILFSPFTYTPCSLSYSLYKFAHHPLLHSFPTLARAFRYFYYINSFPSYCVVVNRHFLISHAIYFDEYLGLGARYPQSEENLFIIRILKSSRYLSNFSVVVFNFSGFSGVSLSHLRYSFSQMVSKGILLFNLYSIFGILLIPIYSLIFSLKSSSNIFKICLHFVLFFCAILLGYLIAIKNFFIWL